MTSQRAAIRLLQGASFISNFDRYLIAPLLIVIATDFDVSISSITLAATAYFVTYGIMQSLWAIGADRLGRVRTLRISLAMAAVGAVLSTIAPTLGLLVAARAITGAAFAASVPGGLIYVGDTVPVATRQAALTDIMTSGAVGLASAAAGAAAIADLLDWRVAFLSSGIVAGYLAIAMRSMPEPPSRPRAPLLGMFRSVLTNRWALVVLFLVGVEGSVLLGFLTFYPATLESTGSSAMVAGLITAVYGVAVVGFAMLVKRLTRNVTRPWLILYGMIFGAFSYGVLMTDQGVTGVLIGAILNGASWAFMHSTLQAWITEVVPEARAIAVSLFASMLFVGSSIGAQLGSTLVEAGQFSVLYGIGVAVIIPLGAVAAGAQRKYLSRANGAG